MRRLVGFVVAVGSGAAIGAFIPGPGPERSWVWPFAGVVIVVAAYLGGVCTTLAQRRFGRWTGGAVIIIASAAMAAGWAVTPAGCGRCTTAELQGWVAAGVMFGVALVTWSVIVGLTRGMVTFTARVVRRGQAAQTRTGSQGRGKQR